MEAGGQVIQLVRAVDFNGLAGGVEDDLAMPAASQVGLQFGGVYIANEKYTRALADQVIQDGEADAVAFGQLFIANPDLPARFASNASLNMPDPSTFFAPGPHGYTDYPELSA